MTFIAFEGIDGSGKSTAMATVGARLAAAGVPHWTTREETDRFGAAIRRSIRDGRDPLVTTYLFMADRAVHVPQIRRHLDDGDVVLSDRFMHSTLAYQGVTLAGRMDDPVAWLRGLHAPLGLMPDRVLWFDLPADVAVARAAGRGATAPYEKTRFLEQVAAQYAELARAEPERFVRIDAAATPEDVADAAWDAVRDALPPWRRQAAAEA